MVKAKVVKAFYYAKGKELYLDEERFNELKELGYVEEVESAPDEEVIEKSIVENNKVEKAVNGKKRNISNKTMEND